MGFEYRANITRLFIILTSLLLANNAMASDFIKWTDDVNNNAVQASYLACSPINTLGSNITKLTADPNTVLVERQLLNAGGYNQSFTISELGASKNLVGGGLFKILIVMDTVDKTKCCVSSPVLDINKLVSYYTEKLNVSPYFEEEPNTESVVYSFKLWGDNIKSVSSVKDTSGELVNICNIVLSSDQKTYLDIQSNQETFSTEKQCRDTFIGMNFIIETTNKICAPYYGSENSSISNFIKCKAQARVNGTSDSHCWLLDPSENERRLEKEKESYSIYMLIKQKPNMIDKVKNALR
jgi:hypothetical protein